MPPQAAPTPVGMLYRIGRAPNPLEWRPAAGHRFDDPANDPHHGYRVLYAGDRLACFLEALAGFREDLAWVAAARTMRPGSRGYDAPPPGTIPSSWLARRRLATFSLVDRQERWLDLRSPLTRDYLRDTLADKLRELRIEDFDASDALGRNRPLTQAIGWHAFEAGYQGIVYHSRHDYSLDCWAIFDGVQLREDETEIVPIDSTDPDLSAVIERWQLAIS